MVVLAFLTDVPVLEKILKHLGLPTSPPPLGPAQYPEQLDLFDDSRPYTTGLGYNSDVRPRPGRSPPADDLADWHVEIDEPENSGDWGA
jgi:hypothetical protein